MKWILPLLLLHVFSFSCSAQMFISRQDAVKNRLRSVKQVEYFNGENRVTSFTHYDEKGRIISELKSEYTDSTVNIRHDTTIFYSDSSWTRINMLNPSDSSHTISRWDGRISMLLSETYSEGFVVERFILVSDSLRSYTVQEKLGDIFNAYIMRVTSTYDEKGRLTGRTFLDSVHYDKMKYELSRESYSIKYGDRFIERTYFSTEDNKTHIESRDYLSVDSVLDSLVMYNKKGKIQSIHSYYHYQDGSDSLIIIRNRKGDTTWTCHVYREPMSRDMLYGVPIFFDGLPPASLVSRFTYEKGTVRAEFYYLEKNGLVYEQIETEGADQKEIRRIHFEYTYFE